MHKLLNHPRGGVIFTLMSLVGFLLFGTAVGVLMTPSSEVLGERLGELVCLQVAFTPERALSIVSSFSANEQEAIQNVLIPSDLALAWGYGLFLAGLIGLLTRRLEGQWFRAGAIIIWAPIAASVLDCIEDLFLFDIVSIVLLAPEMQIPWFVPLIAGIAATLKYTALVIITPVFAVAGCVKAFQSNHSIGDLFLYAFLLINVVMFVARPVPQIIGCL